MEFSASVGFIHKELEYIWVSGSETRVNEGTQHAKQFKTSLLKAEVNGWLICKNYLQKFDHLKFNGKLYWR
jgi:hypothetical protein